MPVNGPIRRKAFRFGIFELDLALGELRRQGLRVKLQDQPLRVLAVLIERAGQVVTREELRQHLWEKDEYVEFDQSLNTAVQKVRRALADSASRPRFVETVPRKGYRFIAPVEPLGAPRAGRAPPGNAVRLPWMVAAGAVALLWFILASSWRPYAADSPSELQLAARPFTFDPGTEDSPSFSPDGARVAYHASAPGAETSHIFIREARSGVARAVQVTDGDSLDVDPAWSPDGDRLVFARVLENRTAHQGAVFQLMVTSPVADSAVYALSEQTFVARNAFEITPEWSRDGRHIVFACRHENTSPQVQICVYSLETGQSWPATLPARSGVGHWLPSLAPDNSALLYMSGTAEEIGLYLQPLSDDLRALGPARPIRGARGFIVGKWSGDGRSVYFLGTRSDGESGLWRVSAEHDEAPRLLRSADGRRLAVWEGPAGRLRAAYTQRVRDAEIVLAELNDLNPPGAAAGRVLAPSTFEDFHPQFSPDGRRIAFIYNRSGLYGVWLLDLGGGPPELLAEVGVHGLYSVPNWSRDGLRIAVDGFRNSRGQYTRNVRVIDVAAKHVSPQLTVQGGRLPSFTGDGRALYYYSDQGGKRALWRVGLDGADRRPLFQRAGIVDSMESPQGDRLYFLQGRDLMLASLRDGEPLGEPVCVAQDVVAFHPVADAVYLRKTDGEIRRLGDHDGVERFVLQTDGNLSVVNLGFSVSPDESRLVYTRWGREEKDLVIAEPIEQQRSQNEKFYFSVRNQ